jgi:hypothetical protein
VNVFFPFFFPFAYEAECLDKRSGRRVNAVRSELLFVALREFTQEEAPVAAEWRMLRGDNQDGLETACRMIDGEFYVPAYAEERICDFHIKGLHDRSRNWSKIAGYARGYSTAFMNHCDLTVLKGAERYDQRGRTVLRSSAEAERTRARAYLEGLVLIDGEVWKKCHRPVLALTVRDFGDTLAASIGVDAPDPCRPWGRWLPARAGTRQFSFPLGPTAAAHDVCEKLGVPAAPRVERIEVFAPDALAFDPADWLAANALVNACSEFEAVAGSLETDVLAAWLDVRDLLGRLDAGLSAEKESEARLLELGRVLAGHGKTSAAVERWMSDADLLCSVLPGSGLGALATGGMGR